MKTNKTSNLLRLIAFFLTGVILVCTFGFTVDGWTKDKEPGNDIGSKPGQGENTQDDNKIPDTPTVAPPEVYYSALTGIETTKELSNKAPTAFVMDKNAPCFGLYGAEIIIDIPTEQSNRLLCIRTNNENLWKIGSIAPTRGYISNFAKFFGAAQISYGTDEIVKYDSCSINLLHDLKANSSLCYSEYERYIYTNSDLISPMFQDTKLQVKLPYTLAPIEEKVAHESNATVIAFDDCELRYDEDQAAYLWYEGEEQKRDLINGKELSFVNCLVLFADSVTYDNVGGCQMVMNTIGSGEGYYASLGGITRIRWTSSLNGNMSLFNENGEPLVINRGNVYIRVLRSSTFNDFFVS